jgi:hypothetical protein
MRHHPIHAWHVLTVAAALLNVGCGGHAPPSRGAITVSALTTTVAVTRITVDVVPAGLSQELTYDAGTGAYGATITSVPSGPQTITVTAYEGATAVGASTTQLTVVSGQVAQISLTVLDTSGAVAVPDHGPVITSFVVPQSSANAGDGLALTSTAVDADGDTIAYAWTVTPGCGTVTSPRTASTTWTVAGSGSCTVSLTVTAGGKTDARSASVAVSALPGSISIAGSFIPNPRITSIALLKGATTVWSVARTGTDATDHTPLQQGTVYGVVLTLDPIADGTVGLAKDATCAGTVGAPSYAFGASTATGSFTPTASSGICILTASVARRSLADAFPIVVVLGP